MGGQSLQVVLNTYSWRSARMESSEPAVLEWDVVVVSDEFEEHVADQEDEIFGVAGFVFGGHGFDGGMGWSGSLGGGFLALARGGGGIRQSGRGGRSDLTRG